MIKTDNINNCPICNRLNTYVIKDIINTIIAEAETTCTKCGHKDYWGYGYFENITLKN